MTIPGLHHFVACQLPTIQRWHTLNERLSGNSTHWTPSHTHLPFARRPLQVPMAVPSKYQLMAVGYWLTLIQSAEMSYSERHSLSMQLPQYD